MISVKRMYQKITSPEFILKNIHNFLNIKHGDKFEEGVEQLMCIKYVNRNDKVLEIGGNIGRVSCILSCILLDEDKQLVVLEPNKDYIPQLDDNRIGNNFNFNIESSAMSYQPLYQRESVTFTEEEYNKLDSKEGCFKVDTLTFNELQEKYNISFNTLVIDCEGAFYHILKDNDTILNNIYKIVIENDYQTKEHKEYVDSILIKYGFKKIFAQALAQRYWRYFPNEYIRNNFYEVWVKI